MTAVVRSTPRPHFTPGKDPVPILQEAGWAPGPVRTDGKSRHHRDSIPDRPARSQSPYRLSYPTYHQVVLEVKCLGGWVRGLQPPELIVKYKQNWGDFTLATVCSESSASECGPVPGTCEQGMKLRFTQAAWHVSTRWKAINFLRLIIFHYLVTIILTSTGFVIIRNTYTLPRARCGTDMYSHQWIWSR